MRYFSRSHRALILLLALFGLQPASGRAADPAGAVAQAVLDKLYRQSGYFILRKPAIKITTENKRVASYYPSKNLIQLDARTYSICRGFGKDSLAALAFVLAHELTHAYQSEIKSQKITTNFLSYGAAYDASGRLEKTADIQGAFLAYLAGYQTLPVCAELLERLYDAYGIKNATLPGYPPLAERLQTAEEVKRIVGQMIELYEAANYLVALEEYELAAKCYYRILKFYQAKEVYNNLGVLYLLRARQFRQRAIDQYLLPIEIDPSLPLRRPDKARGEEALGAEALRLRAANLRLAGGHLRDALRFDPNYMAAHVNTMCLLVLQGQGVEAVAYYHRNGLERKSKNKRFCTPNERETLAAAFAAAHAVSGNTVQAKKAWEEQRRKNLAGFSGLAAYNLAVLAGQQPAPLAGSDLPTDEALRQLAGKLSLGRVKTDNAVSLDDNGHSLVFENNDAAATTLTFEVQGVRRISLKKMRAGQVPDLGLPLDNAGNNLYRYQNLLPTRNGFYLIDEKNQFILLLNTAGKVNGVVRYFLHG